jgi:2-polyprenyl-6-methoxyphenol hydroxylase-like FAD-dependent oxidoreductase
MSARTTTDVLIVGAGPTGLALACQLIRYGIDFVIIDKKETTTPYSKAIGVQARTLEMYEQIGLADKLIELGQITKKVRMLAGGKMRGEIPFDEFGRGMSPYPFILLVEQGLHETLLYDHIKEHGKDVRWQSELVGFSQDDDGVTVNFTNSGGETETVEAKYLVGCDGARSLVRNTLGLRFEGSTFERMFYVADVQVEWAYGHEALQIFLLKNSFLVFFPLKGEKRYRIVGTFPEAFAKDEGDVLYEEIEEQIRLDSDLKLDITKVNWFSTYKVHARHVSEFSKGGCFLAGDSAHIHTPVGAQGMNTGIQDGYNLAWKLALVLKGRSEAKLLDTYNAERLPNAKNLVKTTDTFFNLVASPNPFLVFVRLYIFPYVANLLFSLDVVKRFVFPRISQIAINYRRSNLSKNHGTFKVKAGDRMPYFQMNNQSVYDRMNEPKFHLLAFGGDGFAGVGSDLEDLLDVRNLALTTEVAEIFGNDKPFIVLVRPDNYIGLISSVPSLDEVNEYMAKVLK